MQPNQFNGKWKIVEMDAWDLEFIDLVEPGYIEFNSQMSGEFHFGCIYANMYYVLNNHKIEFTFEGDDEGNEISGRGWVIYKDNELHGHIFFHQGDESGFIARLITD
ncbi:hypothetical protein ACNVED_16805 (plasmid) [Legionella sp. D16C41]|uniref:hypothetical protein n=1 Tax=Legionella sp. D16C41 TaxID=3402688 RepID=UPI003AF64E15